MLALLGNYPVLIATSDHVCIMQLPRTCDLPHTPSTDAEPSIDACMQFDSF